MNGNTTAGLWVKAGGQPLNWLRAKLNSAPVASIAISVLVFLGVYGAREYGVLQQVELVAYDWLVRARPTRPVPPRVSVVTITEADLQALGRWPLPNAILADALRRILKHGPRAVGIDIYTDIPVLPGREELEEILVSNPRIIAGMRFPRANEPGIPPPSVLADTRSCARGTPAIRASRSGDCSDNLAPLFEGFMSHSAMFA